MDLKAILRRIESRLKVVGLSESAASKRAGKTDAIRNLRRAINDGRRTGITTTTLAALAPVLKTTVAWLAEGVGREDAETGAQIRLAGVVRAGSAAILYAENQDGDRWIEPPPAFDEHSFAVEVHGDSLGPLFDRWFLFCDGRREAIDADLINRLCIVGLDDGRILVKKVVRGQLPGKHTLLSNTEPPIYDVAILWAARVREMTPGYH
ncbi:phage repressor protein C with HTH and peptisase S24 domain [Methylosinus sp. sav-2]|nr:phage repressor protein C with HTH and peptisase S24 domain [Methylosinus sp. sav-2]